MTESNLEVILNNEALSFVIDGEFFEGANETIIHNLDVLPPEIKLNGFLVHDILSAAEFENLRVSIAKVLGSIYTSATRVAYQHDILNNYHVLMAQDNIHQKIIEQTRNLENKSFDFDLDIIAERVSELTGLKLSSYNPDIDKTHVQLRISRPKSLDINPPHRDAYLSYYRNVLNLWIPISGCDAESSLPVLPKSHVLNEQELVKTSARGASINNNLYVVPCIKLKSGQPMQLVRPRIDYGQAIVFSPYLIHGAAFNLGEQTRFSLELRLTIR